MVISNLRFGIICCLISASSFAHASAPTIPASNVVFFSVDGTSMRVQWTSGNGQRRIVIARSSTAVTAQPANGTDYIHDDNFGLGQQVATGEYIVYDGQGFFVDVFSLDPATTYHFSVFEYNGTGAGTEYNPSAASGSRSTAFTPSTPATAVSFTNVIGNSVRVNWVNGSGNRRIVVMKEGAPVDANPVDLANYSANTGFGSGSQIGNGNFVVYNNSGTTNFVVVGGLKPSTDYYVAVFEANGIINPMFLTTDPARGNQITLDRPTVASSAIGYQFVEGVSMRIFWTNGNGSRRIVIAKEGSPVTAVPVDGVDYLAGSSASFTAAPEILPGEKVVSDNNFSFTDLVGLQHSTVYHFRIYEYDGTGATIGYLTSSFGVSSRSTLAPPTAQASNLNITNVGATSMRVNWTNGNGSRRIVLAKAGGPVDVVPVQLAAYEGHSTFGMGDQIGNGNFVVSNTTTGVTVNVSGLAIGQTYHFAIFEGNGTASPVYQYNLAPVANATTLSTPTVAPSGINYQFIDGTTMRLNWTSGNGNRRIVIARAGTPVTAVPENGVDYLAGTAASFATAPEILPGEKVVYDNNTTFADVFGLTHSTIYHYRVFEYIANGTSTSYLTSAFAVSSQSTLSPPANPATNMTFTAVTSTSMTVTWTNGNGSRRILVAKTASPVDAVPSNYIQYNPSVNFGQGSQLGSGNYVILDASSATTHSVNVLNLAMNQTYHFAVFEANGNNSPVYQTANPATGSQTTIGRPTLAASGVNFSFIDGNSMRVGWNNGNGTRRIVIAKEGSAPAAIPADGIDYLNPSTSAPFNTAPEIAPGEKVVYDNINNFTDVTGLQPGTTYHFRIYEFTGSGSGILYLVSSFGSGSTGTVTDPSLQAASLSFTTLSAASVTVGWTNGNGGGRLVVMRQGSPVSQEPADLSDYNPSASFGSGSQIGSGNYVVMKSNASSVSVTNLTSGSTYFVAVYEYNGAPNSMYLTPGLTGQVTTSGAPQVQASGAGAGAVTNHSVSLGWTNGSGNKRLVLMKQGSAVDVTPANNINYTANSFFGSGQQLGTGNYVVYDGSQDAVTITNLSRNTVYHVAVYEYNDFDATSQFHPGEPARASIVTGALPVTFTYFKGKLLDDKTVLEWQTASEFQSRHFIIQRSSDRLHYSDLGSVPSKGSINSISDYSFTDRLPLKGVNYYRLQQVDIDGSIEYSDEIQLTYHAVRMIKHIQSPVAGRLVVHLNLNSGQICYIRIVDMNGKTALRQQLSKNYIEMDLGRFSKGTYILQISDGTNVEQRRFVKN